MTQEAAPARRCRHRSRPQLPGALRPTDMMAAFFVLGIGFLLAAAVVAALHGPLGWAHGRWLALHLAFVGGVSQLVLGAAQFFAGAFLTADPPRKALVRAQLAAWNAGALLVVIGVPQALPRLVDAGAALLALGLVAFAAGLRGLHRRSLQRAPWATRWYEASALFLGVGVVAGALLANGTAWTLGSLLGAHMALNLAGWFGSAIVGTLHTFFPSLTQTQLRHPQLQRPTFAGWALGTVALAAGYAFDAGALVVAGWLLLLAAALILCVNLAASLRAAPGPLALPARLIAPAQGCLVAALAVALAGSLGADALTAPPSGATRSALAVLLLPGWLGLTVTGSLLHLLSVLLRVRRFHNRLPAARPLRDGALVLVALAGVVVLALSRSGHLPGLDTPATTALVAAYALLGGLVLARAARALRHGPPRI